MNRDETKPSSAREKTPKLKDMYGPQRETKSQWNTRVSAQPVRDTNRAAMRSRAKTRKGKPIEYEHDVYTTETLRIDTSHSLDKLLAAAQLNNIRSIVCGFRWSSVEYEHVTDH